MGSENDLMELLWRDGQILTQNHSQWNPENNLIHGEAPTSWFQYSSGDLFDYNSNISYETPIDIRSSGLQSMNESRREGKSLSMVTAGSSNCERNQVQVVADVSHNSSDDGTSESGGSDFPFGRTEHFSISNQSQKRKMRNEKESEHHIEGADYDSIATNKMNPQSSFSERNRSNEVHNLSERRRRDRINEKMRALQELIPNCNKLDKASILDDAIEYLKSLQQQLQIMWSSSSMAPVMFPGGQHYNPCTGIGMSMGYVPFRGGSIASQMQMLPSQPIDPTLLNHRQLSDISKSYGHYPQVPTAIASGKRLPTSGEYHSEFTLKGRPG